MGFCWLLSHRFADAVRAGLHEVSEALAVTGGLGGAGFLELLHLVGELLQGLSGQATEHGGEDLHRAHTFVFLVCVFVIDSDGLPSLSGECSINFASRQALFGSLAQEICRQFRYWKIVKLSHLGKGN